eukprot:2638510-Rhodomonas_salina.4
MSHCLCESNVKEGANRVRISHMQELLDTVHCNQSPGPTGSGKSHDFILPLCPCVSPQLKPNGHDWNEQGMHLPDTNVPLNSCGGPGTRTYPCAKECTAKSNRVGVGVSVSLCAHSHLVADPGAEVLYTSVDKLDSFEILRDYRTFHYVEESGVFVNFVFVAEEVT